MWHKTIEDGYPTENGLYLIRYGGMTTPRTAYIADVRNTHHLIRDVVEWKRVA